MLIHWYCPTYWKLADKKNKIWNDGWPGNSVRMAILHKAVNAKYEHLGGWALVLFLTVCKQVVNFSSTTKTQYLAGKAAYIELS